MDSVCNSKENILRSIGIKKGFGSDNRKRLHCYSVLLGCGDIEMYRKSDKYKDRSIQYVNRYSEQIAKDLKRNVYVRWSARETSKYSTLQIEDDLAQIEKLINIVFTEYPQLQYIQSFDSIFSLFYILSEGNLFVAKKIIVSYFHIFKADLIPKSDHFGYFQSKTILALIRKYDPRFYQWFKTKIMADIPGELCGVVFALKWYLSWFCHSAITDLDDILRIYDFMISSDNKTIAIYMIVAVLLINKDRIMTQVEDYTELLLFMEHSMVYNVKEMILKCGEILENEQKATYVQKMWTIVADKFRN